MPWKPANLHGDVLAADRVAALEDSCACGGRDLPHDLVATEDSRSNRGPVGRCRRGVCRRSSERAQLGVRVNPRAGEAQRVERADEQRERAASLGSVGLDPLERANRFLRLAEAQQKIAERQ